MLGNSQFFKIKVYLTRTKNYKKSQPFLGKVRRKRRNLAFGFRPVFRRLLVINKIYHKGRRPKAGFGLVVLTFPKKGDSFAN